MTNTFKLTGVVLVLSMGFVEPAAATSMRCGTHIVTANTGTPVGQYEVLKRCGEPTFRQGNTWIYEKSSSVARRVRFNKNGEIVEIN